MLKNIANVRHANSTGMTPVPRGVEAKRSKSLTGECVLGRRQFIYAGLMAVAGCAPKPSLPPYVAKPARPAGTIAYCSDFVGHQAGAKPYALGGTCCCTPSDALMKKLHADGLCLDMDSDALQAAYQSMGIVTARDTGHGRCNNLCDHGPHVVRGGKCMSPPIPATTNYELVTMGDNEATGD